MEHNDDVDQTQERLPDIDSDATSRHFPLDVDVVDHTSGSWASGGPVVVARSVDDLSEFCRPRIYKACRCLGMSYRAIHGWLAVHDSPCMMTSFFTAALLGLLGPCIAFTYFHPAVTWKFLVPLGISLSSEFLNLLFFWRDGPNHAETRKCHILALLWAIPLIGLSLAAFFRPESSTPFSSQPIFCGAVSAQVFGVAVSCKAGRVPAMRIPKLASLPGLLMESLGITIRVMDILTSMFLVYSIAAEAGDDCAWFGAFGKCEQLIQVAIIMVVFLVLDVSCSFALSALRRVPPPYGSPIAHPRWAMVAHVARILSEFVVLLSALVKLFSDTRVHAGAATPAPAPGAPLQPSPPTDGAPGDHAGMSIPVMRLSLALSVATLVLSILAAGTVVQLLGDSVSVSGSGTSVWSRARRSRRGTDAPQALAVPRGAPAMFSGLNSVAPASPVHRGDAGLRT